MLCFLSKEKDPSKKVKKEEIYFLSCPDGLSKEKIKKIFLNKAKPFAVLLNVDKVFLHFGKDYIEYEFSL